MFLMITVNVLTLFCSHFVLYFSITLSFFSSCSLKVCFHSSECWESARIAIVFLKTLNSCLLYWKYNQSTFPLPIGQETFHVNHLHPPKLGYTVCDVHNFGLTFAKYNNLFIYFKKMQTSIRSIGKTNSDRCQTDSSSDQFSYLFKVCLLVTS